MRRITWSSLEACGERWTWAVGGLGCGAVGGGMLEVLRVDIWKNVSMVKNALSLDDSIPLHP